MNNLKITLPPEVIKEIESVSDKTVAQFIADAIVLAVIIHKHMDKDSRLVIEYI